MYINDELLELIDNNDLDRSEALLFAFAVTYDSQFNTLNSLISSGIITSETEPKYRINLCTHNIESGSIQLKVPLFVHNNKNDSFIEFIKQLGQNHMTSKGHKNNQKNYTIVTNDAETKSAFDNVIAAIKNNDGNVDKDKLIKVVTKYYEETELPLKLEKYLRTALFTDYITSDDLDISNMI